MSNKSRYRIVEKTMGSGKKRYYIHVRNWLGFWYEHGSDYGIPNWFDSKEEAENCVKNWEVPNKIVSEL